MRWRTCVDAYARTANITERFLREVPAVQVLERRVSAAMLVVDDRSQSME